MADDFVAQTPTIESRTWFAIDGALEPIAFEGLSFFRFPQELARLVVDRFSKPGDLVLDPFCGFGTTLVATETLGRRAIGIEKDRERFEFASRRVHASSRVIHGSAFELDTLNNSPRRIDRPCARTSAWPSQRVRRTSEA